MFAGADILKKALFTLILLVAVMATGAWAQTSGPAAENTGVFAVVKDSQGETWEGYLRLNSDEITVQSKDNQEKNIPARYIKSITLEKIRGEAGDIDPSKAGYKVQLENSQELYTLKKKYSFNLNTNLGLVTKTIDPDKVNTLLSKDVSQSMKMDELKNFIQDKSIVFSLEFKF
jgi:hypothetical protein